MIFGNEAYVTLGANNNNNYMDIYTYNNGDKRYSNDEIEAFIIANDIKKKISDNYEVYDFDLGKNRKANYNDFCIILDRGSKMNLFKKVFEYFSIPMEIYKDSNLMEEKMIFILLKILLIYVFLLKMKFMIKSLDIIFTSVARSYVGGLNDDEIFNDLENNGIFRSEVFRICKEISKEIDLLTPNML